MHPWKATDAEAFPAESDEEIETQEEDSTHLPRFPAETLITAAQTPDISELRKLLVDRRVCPSMYLCGGAHYTWCASLSAAIIANLPTNADLLLKYGANPDGFPASELDCYSSSFLRGRSPGWTHPWPAVAPMRRKMLLKHVTLDTQTVPITEGEIQERFKARSRFYSEPDFPYPEGFHHSRPPILPMEAAARYGDLEMIDALSAKGADTTAWLDQQPRIPPNATPSVLSVSSPLHEAVDRENLDTVKFLLDRSHKPDIFPLAMVTRSKNASMLAITKETSWLRGLELMASYTDFSLCTPIFHCSTLHFTVAKLDLTLLKNVLNISKIDVSAVEPSGLQHTLLHVACLPLEESWINVHSHLIHASIHDVRTLQDSWESQPLWPPRPHNVCYFPRRPALVQTWPRDAAKIDQDAQTEVVEFLLSQCTDATLEISKQDYAGNTALHYLVSYRAVNRTLLETLKSMAPEVWASARNTFGYTAQDLFEDGIEAQQHWDEKHMPFWHDPMGAWDLDGETWIDYYKVGRAPPERPMIGPSKKMYY